MKNYKFKVKKIFENTVEIKEENNQKAVISLIKLLAFANKDIFEDSEYTNAKVEIKLEEIESIKGKNKLQIPKKMIELLNKINQGMEIKNEDFGDDLIDDFIDLNEEEDKEYIEVVCDKCGNCIQIDTEDFL